MDPTSSRAPRGSGGGETCVHIGNRFSHIVMPHALPSILTGIRLAVGRGLVVIIAEMFVGSLGGVGFQSVAVVAAALPLALTGWGLTVALDRLSAWLTPWSRLAGQ